MPTPPGPTVRLRAFQIDGQGLAHADRVTAESTARTIVNRATGHIVRPRAIDAHAAPDGYLYLDVLSTTDPAFEPADRRWRLTLWNGNKQAAQWYLEVDHTLAPLVRFDEDGRENTQGTVEMRSRWLTSLEDLTTPTPAIPAPPLADYFTRTQVRELVDPLKQRVDDLEASSGGTSGGGTSTIRMIRAAAGTLSGHRIVTPDPDGTVRYASNTAAGDIHRPLWLTTSAAGPGSDIAVTAYGPVVESSWSWIAGAPVYLGVNGALTQTAPTRPAAVFLARVAVATAPTSLYFDRHPSVALA